MPGFAKKAATDKQLDGTETLNAEKEAKVLQDVTAMMDRLRALETLVKNTQANLKAELLAGKPEGDEYDAYRTALLGGQATVDAEAAARDAFEKRRKERQYRALVGALGVGMGMLAPLVGGAATLRCVEIARDEVAEDTFADWGVAPLEEAFAKREALRLSEACLIVTGRL